VRESWAYGHHGWSWLALRLAITSTPAGRNAQIAAVPRGLILANGQFDPNVSGQGDAATLALICLRGLTPLASQADDLRSRCSSKTSWLGPSEVIRRASIRRIVRESCAPVPSERPEAFVCLCGRRLRQTDPESCGRWDGTDAQSSDRVGSALARKCAHVDHGQCRGRDRARPRRRREEPVQSQKPEIIPSTGRGRGRTEPQFLNIRCRHMSLLWRKADRARPITARRPKICD
jgi:hypothetical protein